MIRMIGVYWRIFLLIICTFSAVDSLDDVVDCTNDDIVTSIFNDAIELTFNGAIRTYTNVTINAILSTTNNEFEKKYIDARLETVSANSSKNLVIFTTEEFARYAAEQSAVRITLKIAFGCDMGRERTLIFFQPIKEGNYYRPAFTQDIYEIVMPTPIFSGFDLTSFLEIAARDDDLTNNQLNFTAMNAEQYNLVVGTKNQSSANSKTYFASVTLNRIYLALPNNITFQIIATDNGVPQLNSTATVIVRADPENSLPPIPKFERSIYNGTLTDDLSLEPFAVQLLADTFSDAVGFRLSGMDSALFMLNSTSDVVVMVELVRKLERADVVGKRYLQLEIVAEHRKLTDMGRTAAIVEVPEERKEYIRFTKSLYEGSIDAAGHLQLEDIILDSSAYSNEIAVQLNGTETGYFNLTQIVNTLRLQLTDAFSIDKMPQQAFISLTVNAHLINGSATATAAVLIKLPSPAPGSTANKQPVFEKPLYVGALTADQSELHLERIVLLAETYTIDTKFSLSGDDLYLFELKTRDNVVDVTLQRALIDGELVNSSTILLVLTAENGDLRAHASVVISVDRRAGENETKRDSSEIFARRWQRGRIEAVENEGQVLRLDEIRLEARYHIDELYFTLEGEEAEYFLIAIGTHNNVTLRLLNRLPAALMESKSLLFLQLHAVSPASAALNDTILLFVELPGRVCVVPAPALTPHFDSSEYVFAAKPDQLGVVGVVSATVESVNASVRFHTVIDSEHLRQRLVINGNNGELRLLSYASPGVYYFSIFAENTATAANASVKARLTVEAVLQCDKQHAAVASCLLTKYIAEEMRHEDIMNVTVGECSFAIFQMYPNDKEFVYINESTKMLSTISIDRESAVFANMLEPQIQIKLKLICGNHSTSLRQAPRTRRAVDHQLLDSDIPYTNDVTILRLIIVDINDNAPQFVYPATPKLLAYPESEIYLELFPQYLAQVQAMDSDVGLNARLRYSMRPNEHFGIDATSGVIYPNSNAFEAPEYTELIVVASDRDGQPDGLSTGTILLVRRLSADYFSLLTFGASGNENKTLAASLMELSLETGYAITLVKEAIMPLPMKGTRRHRRDTADNATVIQKAWVYCFDNDEPVSSAELQSKLGVASDVNELQNIESYAEVGLTKNGAFSTAARAEFTAYIVTITLLGILSVGCLCFLLWRFYWRRRSDTSCCSDNSSMDCSNSATNSVSANVHTFVKDVSNGARCERSVNVRPTKESHENRPCADIFESSPRSVRF